MKRGYAVSGMLYTILVLFMALLLSFLYSMQNKKNILDKLKAEVVEAFYCSSADNIEDLRGSTVVATNATQEDDNALIQLPKEGRYDTTSYLSVPMSELNKNLIPNDAVLWVIGSTYGGGGGAVFDLTNVNTISWKVLKGTLENLRISDESNTTTYETLTGQSGSIDVSQYSGNHFIRIWRAANTDYLSVEISFSK